MRTKLVVDFRDDVSAETLAGNGFEELPVSDYSAVDRLYRMAFATADEAAAAKAKLAHDASVESVDFEALATFPPGEEMPALAAAGESLEAECGVPGATDEFPNDPCFKFQWHLRRSACPTAWKLGHGEGAVVAVIDTGVTQGPRPGRHQVRRRLQLRRQQRERRRRPRPRHPRRRHHRPGDQQQAGRRGRRLRRDDHAAQGAVGAGLGLDGAASPRRSAGPPTTAPRSST